MAADKLKGLPDFDSTMRRLTLPSVTSEMPANGGLLQIGGRSPDTTFGSFQDEIADSLRRIFEIFPFRGDCGWRPGSIYTAWRIGQSISLCTLVVLAFRVQVFGTFKALTARR
jgi:hypothetical protein